jgi:hypothetical protein
MGLVVIGGFGATIMVMVVNATVLGMPDMHGRRSRHIVKGGEEVSILIRRGLAWGHGILERMGI